MKKIRRTIAILAGIGLIVLLPFSCTRNLDVHQAYSFDLVTMPVQKSIKHNETVEIRCTLVREGEYKDAEFFIRMFQTDGKGELQMDNGTVFLPNDLYPLEKTVFRLYYTSLSEDQQTISVFIEDSFGQMVEKVFSWQNERTENEGMDKGLE